jgi:hypothetical protein
MSDKPSRRNDKAYQQAYYLRNKDKLKKQKKQQYAKVQDEYCKRSTTYYYRNKPYVLKQMRIRHLKISYDMTTEDYDKMLLTQNNSCAICKVNTDLLTKMLCVDHDHKTGKVRGLLCDSCNRGLGYFKDNPETTKKATEYLTKHQ